MESYFTGCSETVRKSLGHGENFRSARDQNRFLLGNSCTTGVIPGSVGNICVEFLNNLAPHKRGNGFETFLLEKPVSTDVVLDFAGNLYYPLFPQEMEGHCSTGQSPQWAVAPMEEEEDYFLKNFPLFRRGRGYQGLG